MNMERLIRSGNVITTEYKEAAETGRYLGNGRFGGVMSGLGLNMSPKMQAKYPWTGQSHFTHLNHWGRFRFVSDAMEEETVADYMLPLFKMHWEEEPEQVRDYNQSQDFYDGVLTTSYTLENGTAVKVTNWFDMVNKNLSGVQLEASEGTVPVKISVITEFVPYEFLYKTRTAQQVSVEQKGNNWCVTIGCEDTLNHRSSSVYFTSNAPVESCDDGIRILVSKGRSEIFISYGEPVAAEDAAKSIDRTRDRWHRIWEESGWMDFPEETAQKTWIRSAAYMVASYADDLGPVQPVCGLTGNMFPFHFVQDMEYISPAMMMMGHADIVKRWIEKFAGEMEEMKQYAKSLWPEAEGIYPPWELP